MELVSCVTCVLRSDKSMNTSIAEPNPGRRRPSVRLHAYRRNGIPRERGDTESQRILQNSSAVRNSSRRRGRKSRSSRESPREEPSHAEIRSGGSNVYM